LTEKYGHHEFNCEFRAESGTVFRLIIRQNSKNRDDFSVILACLPPSSSAFFRLRRYNGKSHEHTNKLEQERFYDFHIHTATERYQEEGQREDGYAEPTDRYHDLEGAIDCMIADCAFQKEAPETGQTYLFPGGEA